MKRLHYANLAGVLALAALCVTQWQNNRGLNLEVNRLEKARFEQADKLAEQEQTMRGLNGDLVQFKEQFSKSQAELIDARQKIRSTEYETRQLTTELEQLKISVTDWAAAVTARDERLREANGQIRRLADELNGSVRQFNELAANHNAAVKELNDLRLRAAPGEK